MIIETAFLFVLTFGDTYQSAQPQPCLPEEACYPVDPNPPKPKVEDDPIFWPRDDSGKF